MENYYFLVDDDFLNAVNSEFRKDLINDIDIYVAESKMERDQCRSYVILCPYCNNLARLTTGIHKNGDKEVSPFVCAFCGEATPYHKIVYSIKKAQILYDLAVEKNQINKQNARVLLEQSIVVLATGIELYFKEIYILTMDLKYVKPEYSLHSKFNKDVKNDFLNVGIMVSKFKTDLNIDITKLLGHSNLTKLKNLMLMRNVIVHNNGNVDAPFLNNIPKDEKNKYDVGKPVPITERDIAEFISTTGIILDKVERKFDQIIYPELKDRIITKFSHLQH